MRILVISDSHGNNYALKRAVALSGGFDRIFHLGDNCRDAEFLADYTAKPIDNVRGNCDYTVDPAVKLVDICGKRFFLTHGHNYSVGYSLYRLTLAAKEAQADMVLFGHTHTSLIDYDGALMILNPGSISRARGCAESFAIIEIDDNGIMRADIHLMQEA